MSLTIGTFQTGAFREVFLGVSGILIAIVLSMASVLVVILSKSYFVRGR